jgi:hypothetical protein
MVDAGYKINWRNITIAAGIALIGSYLLRTSTSSNVSRHSIAERASPELTQTGSGLTQTRSAEMTIGEFKCSAKDSAEVKRLTPIDTQGQLESDKEALEAQGRELADLQVQIEATPTNEFSSSSDVGYHNQMVDQYNLLQSTYESDATALKQRVDAFTPQMEVRDSYLEQHCAKISQ